MAQSSDNKRSAKTDQDGDSLIRALDEWYARHCDGEWEHRYGVTIETCDNPGWLITFKDLLVNVHDWSEIKGDLLKQHGAEIVRDGKSVRIFARSLRQGLEAANAVLNRVSSD